MIELDNLAKMAGVKFDVHYHVTSVDPPELIYFIRENYPDVIDVIYEAEGLPTTWQNGEEVMRWWLKEEQEETADD